MKSLLLVLIDLTKRLMKQYKESFSTVTMTISRLKSLMTKYSTEIRIEGVCYVSVPVAMKTIMGCESRDKYRSYTWVCDNISNAEWSGNHPMDYWRKRLLRKQPTTV